LKRGGCLERSGCRCRSPCWGWSFYLCGLHCWKRGRITRDRWHGRRGKQPFRNGPPHHTNHYRSNRQCKGCDQPLPAGDCAGAARAIKNDRPCGLKRTDACTRGKQGQQRKKNDNQCNARAHVHKLQDYTAFARGYRLLFKEVQGTGLNFLCRRDHIVL
jgi:hypothetical protein